MDTRRGFLTKLFGGAALASMPIAAVVAKTAPVDNSLMYRGWKCEWSGWIKPMNQLCYVGHWVGSHPALNYMAVSPYPGEPVWAYPTQMFSITVMEGQAIPLPSSTPEELERYRVDALSSLKKLIDADDLPSYFRRNR